MNYRVVWDVSAYRELERIWSEAEPVHPYLNAFDEIDSLLSVDAHEQGESRPDGRRILIVSPLGVLFRAQPRLLETHVLQVWSISRRK